MKIAQVNVRLCEGGAAQIALNLHQAVINSGNSARFYYGYGSKARPSSDEHRVAFSQMLGSTGQVVLNYLSHRTFGADVFWPGRWSSKIIDLTSWADIIHLHVLHSHFLPVHFFREVARHKAVVWTHHDSWGLTGRCAVPGNCMGWQTGCIKCLNLGAYPQAYFDRTEKYWETKRNYVRNSSIVHVSPSKHLAEKLSDGFNSPVLVIPNGVQPSNRLFENRGLHQKNNLNFPIKNILVIANDLSDPNKTDRQTIQRLSESGLYILNIVGNNSPFSGPCINNIGPVYNKKLLDEIYSNTDALLFTSKIDNAPLVIMEALTRAVPVIAVESDAAIEILKNFNAGIYKSDEHLIEELSSSQTLFGWENWTYQRISECANRIYSSKNMTQSYLDLYEKLHQNK
jgi:putative colanic acid biosynthesis glycosyltransferase